MSTGIKPKVIVKGKQFNEHAKRYMFYPTSNINFAGTQAISPIWNPKFPKGRIVLLESFEYATQVVNEGEHPLGSTGVVLGERTMGTDAQVKFLMGGSDGGLMAKGMTMLEPLTDVDVDTVLEVEALILPDETVPETLILFKQYLNGVVIPKEESPVNELAIKVLALMKIGVDRAISWCTEETNNLEQELNQGRNGGIGIKSLSPIHRMWFEQIHKPLPEDVVGRNMGNELTKALAPLLNLSGVSTNTLESDIEKKELEKKLALANETIKQQEETLGQQAEALEVLTTDEITTEPDTASK